MTTLSASSQSEMMNFRPHPASAQAIERIGELIQNLITQDEHAARKQLRQQAFAALRTRGFPSRKEEDWQYTPLAALLKQSFKQGNAAVLTEADIQPWLPPFEHRKLVFVDGVLHKTCSDEMPKGVRCELLGQADASFFEQWQTRVQADQDPFDLLNLALLQEGVVLSVEGAVEVPLLILNIITQAQQVVAPRHVVRLAASAQLTLIEHTVSLVDAPLLDTTVVESVVEEGASFRHLKLQRLSEPAYYMGHHYVRQQAHSNFSSFYAALGAEVSRHFTHTVLQGEYAQAEVNSAGLAHGEQVMDSRTYTDHAVPNCMSRQVHKLVIDGAARGVFDGMIRVARGAQKTDGLMDNKNLLLGPRAKVDAKPRLEIYADDVKCSHGSATGQLDLDQLFYLRARGLDEASARRMITTAFLVEPFESISNDAMRTWMQQALSAKLAG